MYCWIKSLDLTALKLIKVGTYYLKLSINLELSFLFLETKKLWNVSVKNSNTLTFEDYLPLKYI